MEAAVTPFPRPDRTPPVTKINLVLLFLIFFPSVLSMLSQSEGTSNFQLYHFQEYSFVAPAGLARVTFDSSKVTKSSWALVHALDGHVVKAEFSIQLLASVPPAHWLVRHGDGAQRHSVLTTCPSGSFSRPIGLQRAFCYIASLLCLDSFVWIGSFWGADYCVVGCDEV
jgi:hypothetical protein